MKTYRIFLERLMEIEVLVQAGDVESAKSEALGIAETVGYTNLDPMAKVFLQKEADITDAEEV